MYIIHLGNRDIIKINQGLGNVVDYQYPFLLGKIVNDVDLTIQSFHLVLDLDLFHPGWFFDNTLRDDKQYQQACNHWNEFPVFHKTIKRYQKENIRDSKQGFFNPQFRDNIKSHYQGRYNPTKG